MYAGYLARLLEPLGVYDLRESSVSGAMVCALGEALDELQLQLQADLAGAFPQSAEGEALSRWERVLPRHGADPDPETRRAALAYLLSRDAVSCSAEEICAALAACGISVRLEANGQNQATVYAPAGTADSAEWSHLIRSLTPAHMELRYAEEQDAV